MGNDQKVQLVNDAMSMAVTQRKPDSVIHHIDQGLQYTSVAFGWYTPSRRHSALGYKSPINSETTTIEGLESLSP